MQLKIEMCFGAPVGQRVSSQFYIGLVPLSVWKIDFCFICVRVPEDTD